MWDIDLSDTDLDFLDTDISSKHFVCLQDVLKTNKCLLGLQSKFEKIWHTFVKASLYVKDLGNPAIWRVSFLSTGYLRSTVFLYQLDENSEFALCAIATSASSLSNFSFRSLNSSKTLALEDSILLWRFKAIPVKLSLLRFLKACS